MSRCAPSRKVFGDLGPLTCFLHPHHSNHPALSPTVLESGSIAFISGRRRRLS
jgi:hypothetical protein